MATQRERRFPYGDCHCRETLSLSLGEGIIGDGRGVRTWRLGSRVVGEDEASSLLAGIVRDCVAAQRLEA